MLAVTGVLQIRAGLVAQRVVGEMLAVLYPPSGKSPPRANGVALGSCFSGLPGRGFSVGGRLFEEPGGGGAEEGQQGGPAEDVDVGHQGGLLLHEAVDQSEGAGAGLGGADGGQIAGERWTSAEDHGRRGRGLRRFRSGGGRRGG